MDDRILEALDPFIDIRPVLIAQMLKCGGKEFHFFPLHMPGFVIEKPARQLNEPVARKLRIQHDADQRTRERMKAF